MSSQDYLNNIPIERFDELIPTRRAIIEAASDEFPQYEFNANVVAASLHPKVQHVVVSSVRDLNGAKYITFSPDEEKGTKKLAYFQAGQYISLKLKIGDSVLTRPYSLCSSPKDALEGHYEILVKQMKDGFASNYIAENFKVGTKLDISEPSGFFTYEPLRDSKHVIGVAGGSGLAPFVSFAKAIADGTEDFNLTILYGSKKEEEILLKEELTVLDNECDKLRIVHVLSDEDKPDYEHGFISAELIARYAESDNYSLFVCGSQGMYDYIEKEAHKLSLPPKYVRFDAYGEYRLTDRDSDFTDQNAGKTYAITVLCADGQTREIPAKAEESVLVALERAGIEAPSKCRSGECGFCRTKLASGEVYVPKKVEKRRQYDKVNGYIHPCASFPRSDLKILIDCEEPKKERKVKDMKKKERLMGLIMAIIISAAMGVAATILVRLFNKQAAESSPLVIMLLSNVIMSVVLGVIISLVLPLGKLGRKLAAAAHANPPSFKFTLLNSLPISIINTVIIGFLLSGFGIFMARMGIKRSAPPEVASQILGSMPPFPIMWAVSFFEILIPTLIISYLLAVILSPIISQAVGLADAGAEVGRAQKED
ncbi:MAG: 2Fe-2S iron-sulfur cluster binding domain-containing protein [Lachnospiraceae bacterium]|nr:2Fe-2S iron-sulfur cluster binding domain-containing protein [Lachnospiraceae bacterium]